MQACYLLRLFSECAQQQAKVLNATRDASQGGAGEDVVPVERSERKDALPRAGRCATTSFHLARAKYEALVAQVQNERGHLLGCRDGGIPVEPAKRSSRCERSSAVIEPHL